jgi:hypothetical protein
MKFIFHFVTMCLFIQASAQNEESILEKALLDLPQVSFKKNSKPQDKFLTYTLKIKQPLDHLDPGKGFFYQSVVLTHKGFQKPTVMETEGYEGRYGGNEIEKLLDANNINVEHRYFGNSKPDSLQWQYLTFEQVTADLHAINQLFRSIYKNKWISTGISRGGLTSIYYKHFYPDDIDLTIPYVAPLPNSIEDRRIYHFLDTIGTQDCRDKIFAVQKFLLEHADEAINKLKWYAKGKKLTFDHFGSIGKAFEMGVLEYPFAFWQIGDVSCDKIPTTGSVDDYLEHLMAVGSVDYLSDAIINQWAANGYTAYQTGFYGYDLGRYKNHLRYVKGENPTAAFVPKSIPCKPYDSTFNKKVNQWLYEKGNDILYIYGSWDTWSACRVIVSNKVNSKSYLIANANHFQARIKNMPAEMQRDFASTISKMINLNVDLNALK